MKADTSAIQLARRRALGYYLIALALGGLVIVLPYTGWQVHASLDNALETGAGICALFAGVLLMRRSHQLADTSLTLVLGAALICSGLFACGQLMLWQTPLGDHLYSPVEAVSPWYWSIERLTFAMLCVAALLASRRASILGPDNGITPRIVIFGAIGMTLPILVYFFTSPVPQLPVGDPPLRRPLELFPLILLGGCLLKLMRSLRWRHETLFHWLVLSLLLHLSSVGLVLVHGGLPGTIELTAAQMMRMLGHAAILVGVARVVVQGDQGKTHHRTTQTPPTGLLRFGLRGIGLRLLLLFGIMMGAVVLLTGLNDYWVERDALIKANSRHLNSIAGAQQSAIQLILAQYRAEAALITSRTQLRNRLARIQNPGQPAAERSADLKKINAILSDAASVIPHSPRIALFDRSGTLVTQVGQIHARKFIANPAAVIATTWHLDLHFDAAGPVLVLNSPLVLRERQVGSLVLLLSPEELFTQLHSHTDLGQTTETLLGRLGDHGGIEIIAPLRLRPHDPRKPYRTAPDLMQIMAQAVAGVENDPGIAMPDYRGVPVYYAARKLESVNWGLIVKIDADEILQNIRALGRHHMRNGISILAFALVVAYIAITVFLAPLQRLVRYTEKIRDGQYGFRLRNLADDEIGQLGGTLNNMAESIERHTQELKEKSRRISTIVDNMVDALVVIDQHGRIESANPAVTELFGYQQHELIGKNVNMLMPEPYRSRHDGYLQRYVSSGERRVIGLIRDLTAERKDGSLFPIELTIAEIRLDDQIRFTGFVRDITERLAAEQKLAEQNTNLIQANEDLEQFAYIASHDLKTPLRAVDNLVQWIEEDLDDNLPGDAATNMARLKERVRRMESMIQDLLEFSRAGRRHASPSATDCNALVQGIVLDLAPPEGLSIVAYDLPTVVTPRPALETVLRNLIANAVNHHDRPVGEITVQAKDDGDYLEFSVSDDGPGIPEQFHTKIFQIFQSLSAKNANAGTGMGLALVKRLVQTGGGHIEVRSSAGQRGTTFVFQWPRLWPRHEAPGEADSQHTQEQAP